MLWKVMLSPCLLPMPPFLSLGCGLFPHPVLWHTQAVPTGGESSGWTQGSKGAFPTPTGASFPHFNMATNGNNPHFRMMRHRNCESYYPNYEYICTRCFWGFVTSFTQVQFTLNEVKWSEHYPYIAFLPTKLKPTARHVAVLRLRILPGELCSGMARPCRQLAKLETSDIVRNWLKSVSQIYTANRCKTVRKSSIFTRFTSICIRKVLLWEAGSGAHPLILTTPQMPALPGTLGPEVHGAIPLFIKSNPKCSFYFRLSMDSGVSSFLNCSVLPSAPKTPLGIFCASTGDQYSRTGPQEKTSERWDWSLCMLRDDVKNLLAKWFKYDGLRNFDAHGFKKLSNPEVKVSKLEETVHSMAGIAGIRTPSLDNGWWTFSLELPKVLNFTLKLTHCLVASEISSITPTPLRASKFPVCRLQSTGDMILKPRITGSVFAVT